MKKSFTFVFFFLLIFLNSATAQLQLGSTLIGSDDYDFFGKSVALSADGEVLVVGAPSHPVGNMLASGQVRTFSWDGSDWQMMGTPLDGTQASEVFGRAVALSADGLIMAVGAPGYANGNGLLAGKVQVYSRNGSDWTFMGDALEGDDDNIVFGYAVALSDDGMTLAVGIPFYNPAFLPMAGQVRIYEWDGSAWQESAVLNGESPDERFGSAVTLSGAGDVLAVGAPNNGDAFGLGGKVSVYQLANGVWEQQGEDLQGTSQISFLGSALALSQDGQTLAAAAPRNSENGTDAGQVQIYAWDGDAWVAKGDYLQGSAGARLGAAVALSSDGNVLFSGAPYFPGSAGIQSGRVFIYRWDGSNWVEQQIHVEGLDANDHCGSALAFSKNANRLAVASDNAGNAGGISSGNVRVFEICEPVSSGISVTACQSYTVPSGNATYTESGVYEDHILNAAGCGDSIITIALTIISVETTISWEPPQLIAAAASAEYQWVDCNDNYAPIPGQTQQVFVPGESGSYAVIISQSGCVDTSSCQQVMITGLAGEPAPLEFDVFPNPVLEKDFLHLHFGQKYEQVHVSIYNALGEIVREETFSGGQDVSLEHKLLPGAYFILCKVDGAVPLTAKIMVE